MGSQYLLRLAFSGQVSSVRYHHDWCTMNKRMIWIPTRGLFLTCTENSFYSAHIYNKFKRVHFYLKEKYSYLER
jgi:hypothetical protein